MELVSVTWLPSTPPLPARVRDYRYIRFALDPLFCCGSSVLLVFEQFCRGALHSKTLDVD